MIAVPPSLTSTTIADAFEKSGCDWILKFSDREQILLGVAEAIRKFQLHYHEKFGEYPDPLAMLAENRPKGAAFFQAFTGPPLSLEVLTAIWRILLGSNIEEVRLHYKMSGQFQFQISVTTPYVDQHEIYTSDNPWDISIFRHLGLLTVEGKLVLDGFYALKNG